MAKDKKEQTKVATKAAPEKKKVTPKKPPEKLEAIADDPTADDQATVGAFVKVVKGDHEGRYGVLLEAHSLDTAIVRTRDSMNEHIVVKYSELEPADAGLR